MATRATCYSIWRPERSEIVVPNRQSEDVFNLMKNVLFPYMTVRRGTELDDTLMRNPHLNFAPRLGIAYQLNNKTVIRTGYGIYSWVSRRSERSAVAQSAIACADRSHR